MSHFLNAIRSFTFWLRLLSACCLFLALVIGTFGVLTKEMGIPSAKQTLEAIHQFGSIEAPVLLYVDEHSNRLAVEETQARFWKTATSTIEVDEKSSVPPRFQMLIVIPGTQRPLPSLSNNSIHDFRNAPYLNFLESLDTWTQKEASWVTRQMGWIRMFLLFGFSVAAVWVLDASITPRLRKVWYR